MGSIVKRGFSWIQKYLYIGEQDSVEIGKQWYSKGGYAGVEVLSRWKGLVFCTNGEDWS